MRKKFRKVLCYLLTCAMLSLMLPYQIGAMDYSLQAIDTSRLEIIRRTSAGVIYDSEEARSVVPQNAIINEVYQSNDTGIVYVDYTVSGTRYIDEYFPDGTVHSNSLSGNVLTTRCGNEVTNSIINSVSHSFSMNEETIADIKEAVLNNGTLEEIEGIQINEYNGKTFIEPKNININDNISVGMYSLQSANDYTEVTYPLPDGFQPYNTKATAWETRYISELDNYTSVYAFETQDYYTRVRADYTNFLIGATLTGISLAVAWPTSIVQAMLVAANVLSVTNTLLVDIIFFTSEDIEYWFAVEGGVYDTTRENAIVRVNMEEEWGTLTYGLDSNNEVEWIRANDDTPEPLKYQISGNYDPILDAAAEIYNNNLEAYGYWQWGVGNFGG